jgi:hypothetical protein
MSCLQVVCWLCFVGRLPFLLNQDAVGGACRNSLLLSIPNKWKHRLALSVILPIVEQGRLDLVVELDITPNLRKRHLSIGYRS